MKWLGAVIVAVGLCCCGHSGPTNGNVGQVGGADCGDPNGDLEGTLGPGSDCTDYTDCESWCCSCSNGDGLAFQAAECFDGVCQGPSNTCNDEEGGDVCR